MKQLGYFDDNTEKVCELDRSLYGLKQATRRQNRKFRIYLVNLGFPDCEAEPCLYIRNEEGNKLIRTFYIDDGLVDATDPKDFYAN